MIAGDDSGAVPLLVLTGMTAGWRRRGLLRRSLKARMSAKIMMPWLPWALGLRGCASWLGAYLRWRSLRRADVLAYIGGGYVLRAMAANGMTLEPQRLVYDRGSMQEAVPALLLRRFGRLGLCLTGYAAVVGAADAAWLSDLPLPRGARGTAVLVETEASRLARVLGLRPEGRPDPKALLPGADAAALLPLSHDDVYAAPTFLDAAMNFLATGRLGTVAPHG
jgi:hypothetical protein